MAASNKKNVIRVLHVDDDPSLQEITKLMLLDLDKSFEIDNASCVDEAFMKLSTGEYDVVVSDYEMPRKNGLQFLTELRNQNILIPFILFTGKGREEVAIKALNLGADGYINKQGGPQTVYGELAHRIRLSVSHKKAEQLFRQSEEKFRKLFELVRFSVAVFNLEKHVYVDCNPSFEKMCGYSREEIIGKNQVTKLPASELEKYIQVLLKEGYVEIKGVELVTKFGETKLVEGYFTLVNINGEAHTISNLIDVTESKKAEEALRNSEAKLRGIVECSSDQIFLLDKNLKFLMVNSSLADVLGRSPEEIIGKSIGEVYGLETATQFSDNIKTVFKIGKSMLLEEKMVAQGQELFISTSLNPIKDDLGNVTAVSGIVRDITDGKKNEHAFRESESRYRLLAENAQDVIWTANLDGLVTYISPSVLHLRGYSAEEAMHQSLFESLTPSSAQIVLEGMQRFVETGDIIQTSFELEQPCKDGSTVWVESKFTILRNNKGEPLSILGVSRNITERKKTEEKQQLNAERFKLAQRISQVGIWDFDVSSGELFWDEETYRISGVSSELRPSLENFFKIVHPDDLEFVKENIQGALEGKPYDIEMRILRPDGIERVVNTLGEVNWDSQGKPNRFFGIVQDITERKKADNTLRKTVSDLEESQRIAGLGTYLWNISTGVFESSPVLDDLFGIDKTYDHTTEGWLLLIHPDDRTMMADYIQKEVVGRRMPFDKEYRIVRPTDKAVRFLHGLGKLEFDSKGYPVTMKGTILDITERKNTEDALRKEQTMLESVTKNIGAGLVMISKDYKILWMNNFLRQFTGASENNHCYSSFNTCTTICPDCGPKKIFEGASIDRREYCNKTEFNKDHPVWFELIATPIKDADGNIVAALELTVNITEKKEAEQELRKNSEKIELINEKLHVVGSLTRHDVGNKLMAAKSNLYLLKKRIGDNPDLVKYLDSIDSALASSDEIFEFSRLYERIGVEKPSKENVFDCFNQAVTLMPNLGNVEVVNECKGLVVVADSLLKQLFYNFIDNSLKHGEKVTKIRLHYNKEDDGGTSLVYEDNGVGVSEANKSKLFDKGFTTGRGSGLGLISSQEDDECLQLDHN